MRVLIPAAALLILAACAPQPPGVKLPSDALDQAIGGAIGDPTTCVVIAERASHRIVYRYGDYFNCRRALPACDRAGTLSAEDALALADTPDGHTASCSSLPDGSRSVGWTEGRVVSPHRDLIYSAVMEGERALPGQEMASRLGDAFQQAGL